MFIGISIKKNNKFYFSKPLIIDNLNSNENYFYAFLSNDIDYSIILNYNEEIILNIVKYNNKDSYYFCNIYSSNIDEAITLRTYNIYLEHCNNKQKNKNDKRELFEILLDEENNLEFNFSVINICKLVRKYNSNDYILSLPVLKGKKSFINEYK